MSSFSGARRKEIGPTTKRETLIPATSPATAPVAMPGPAPVPSISRSAAQKVVAFSIATATRLPTQKNQNVPEKPRRAGAVARAGSGSQGAPSAGAMAGTLEEPSAPRPGSDPMRTAATPASTIVTATAGRQPQPTATLAPTASGARSPNSEPTPLASTTAAALASLWWSERAGCAAEISRVPPMPMTATPGRVTPSVRPETRITTPSARTPLAMSSVTRRPNRSTMRALTRAVTTVPAAIAVPCSPAWALVIPISRASNGTLGEKLYSSQPHATKWAYSATVTLSRCNRIGASVAAGAPLSGKDLWSQARAVQKNQVPDLAFVHSDCAVVVPQPAATGNPPATYRGCTVVRCSSW